MNKIAICGKGGSGKSTVVALLAKALREKHYKVLVVDSDESNTGLYRMLGLDQAPLSILAELECFRSDRTMGYQTSG